MNDILINTINNLEIKDPQTANNLTVYPLVLHIEDGPNYITFPEALQNNHLSIKEVNNAGSVPDLIAINKGDMPVLGLNGEELVGAKQNRVLNTTVLLAAHSETTIPVSCTEQGRWSYTSPNFSDSQTFMSPDIRSRKMRQVNRSYKAKRGPRSDQRVLWKAINSQHSAHKVHSQTGAMDDTYKAKEQSLVDYTEHIKPIPGQTGMLAFINGKPIGFDLLSRPKAYADIHSKLAASYALDALAQRTNRPQDISAEVRPEDILNQVKHCTTEQFASVGLGIDTRIDNNTLVGSALVFNQMLIHLALFEIK